MKTLILITCLAIGSGSATFAQLNEETVTANATSKTQIPIAVLNAYKKDFPGGKSIDAWKLIPAQAYADKYAVNEQGEDVTDGKTDNLFYSVDLSGKGVNAQAVYNSNGKLLVFKEDIKNTQLPAAIVNRVEEAYPNAVITSDHERIRLENNKKRIIYTVKFKQNGKAGKVQLDENGTLLKARK
ncbi:hypothetical protein GCM10028807_42500 [Spirosoma daeguense]